MKCLAGSCPSCVDRIAQLLADSVHQRFLHDHHVADVDVRAHDVHALRRSDHRYATATMQAGPWKSRLDLIERAVEKRAAQRSNRRTARMT